MTAIENEGDIKKEKNIKEKEKSSLTLFLTALDQRDTGC